MLTIQDVGTEILERRPRKFYIFGGSEYGIKRKYISILIDHYKNFKECQSVDDVLASMSTKHFIPLEPTLYIVRYDENFVSSASETTSDIIESANIIGTIICIYESDKHVNKLAKYLPNFTVRIDPVNVNFKIKYLKSDFPSLPEKLITLAATYGIDYNDAKNICASMSMVEPDRFFAMSDKEIIGLFGKQHNYTDSDIKCGVASRNFNYLVHALDNYEGEYDTLFYSILSTMIEMEKVISNKHAQSEFSEFSKNWVEPDIYNMFMNTYSELQKIRSYSVDAKFSLIYLFGLLKFKRIPSVEFMEAD